MDYLEQGQRIWRDFVPASGQATTVQGELLRAVEKLRDEATRNGNWDEGFAILLAYLERHLLDPATFMPEVLAITRNTLTRLAQHEEPLLEDEPYDELGDRVCDWFARHGSRPHQIDARLKR